MVAPAADPGCVKIQCPLPSCPDNDKCVDPPKVKKPPPVKSQTSKRCKSPIKCTPETVEPLEHTPLNVGVPTYRGPKAVLKSKTPHSFECIPTDANKCPKRKGSRQFCPNNNKTSTSMGSSSNRQSGSNVPQKRGISSSKLSQSPPPPPKRRQEKASKEFKCGNPPPKEVKFPPCPKKPPVCGNEHEHASTKPVFYFVAVAFLVSAFIMWLLFSEEEEKKEKDGKETKKDTKGKIPKTSDKIPNKMAYLFAGSGTASFAAVRAILSKDAEANILILASEHKTPYLESPICSNTTSRAKLLLQRWSALMNTDVANYYKDFKMMEISSKGKVQVIQGWEINSINPEKHKIVLIGGHEIEYEKLFLEAELKAKPLEVVQSLPENVKDRFYYYKDISDFQPIMEKLGRRVTSVTVIGGGLAATELSCALARRGNLVTQICKEPGPLAKLLPLYLTQWTKEQVENEGVNFISEGSVTGAEIVDGKLFIQLQNGQKTETEFCIVAGGTVVDDKFSTKTKLPLDAKHERYYLKDSMQATTDVYMAGDGVTFERRPNVKYQDHAIVTGWIAGQNMMGDKCSIQQQMPPGMVWSDLTRNIGWEGTGQIDSKHTTVGVFSDSKKPSYLKRISTKDGKWKNEKGELHFDNDFSKGVIFYLDANRTVIGIVLWNLFDRMTIAQQIIKDERRFDEVNIGTLFFA